MKHRLSGFTILEVLIVIAVFGLFVALAALSLSSARARLRDTQRVSDVSILRSAFNQHWLEKAQYPTNTSVLLAKPGAGADVLTSAGFVARDAATGSVYLNRVPAGPKAGEYYKYRGGPSGYSLRFQTEKDTAFGKANVYYAHASGIDNADELK